MKLRNKKTGEIHEITQAVSLSDDMNKKFAIYSKSEGHNYAYRSLAELNEEWEDYKEPKEYWYIDYDGGILCGESDNTSAEKMMISMGNHFKSLKEADKAVEKLKAWKRLRDKGFRFTLTPGVGSLDITPGKFQIEITADMPAKWFCCDAVQKDLEVCFGGEK